MEEPKDKLGKSNKLRAVLYSLLIVLPIYSVLAIAYYFDFLNGFVFLGALSTVMIIASILLIIFRKNNFKSLVIALIFIVTFLLFCYECLLLNYESHTYNASGYWEPEEILKDSGIYILAVGSYDVYYMQDEYSIKKDYEEDGIQIFDLYKIKNRDKYISKTNDIKNFFGSHKEDFDTMRENVKGIIEEDLPFIDEFLSRENFVGDSAGLALGLTAAIYQKKLENTLPIGVTGTLEPNGNVGEIGSIKEKMMIAEQNSFPLIIIPLKNLEEAETVKNEQKLTIEIIPVSNINEAIETIEELNNKVPGITTKL